MLDVHILKRADLDPDVWARCEVSVASFYAKTHVIPAEPGHIGRGRIRGYAQGDQPFVTYVDDDDMIAPGLLDYLNGYLTAHPDTSAIWVMPTAVAFDAPLPQGRRFTGLWPFPRGMLSRFATRGGADHMWVFRRDLMPDLAVYEQHSRGGDALYTKAYLSAIGESATARMTKAPYYFWCGEGR